MGLLYKSSKLLKIILDSLEDQEGGAMYISCDVSNGGPVEPETGYVPNNPLFGLALDSPQQECAASSCIGCLSCQGNTVLPLSSLPTNDFDCGSCFDPIVAVDLGVGPAQNNSQVILNSTGGSGGIVGGSGNTCTSNYWSTDEMASTFPGLPALDIDPLPSLFPFSPCGASYNFSTNPHHQASLSYTVHPHQMLISPNSHHQQTSTSGVTSTSASSTPGSGQHLSSSSLSHSNALNSSSIASQSCYYDPINVAGGNVSTTTAGNSCALQHMNTQTGASGAGNALYPSMSVNVSMNMTMHGYGATDATMPMQCSQMQWAPTNSSSAVNVLYPPLLSPSHYPGAATYSFTADFRSPSLQSNQNHNNMLSSLPPESLEKDSSPSPMPPTDAISPKSFYASTQVGQSYSPPTKSPTLFTQIRDTKPSYSQLTGLPLSSGVASGYEDEDSNEEGSESKPNLCRLCGKTYARPSTLKTHLRTHSGERPYRCPDCNKSFSQAANLTAHVRTHTGQKPFRCPICDRRFSQSSSVTTHMRTHSGERPYRCSACKKSFSDSSTLTKHLRIHSGEKPYQCKLCLLRFSQSGNLNRHMRVHSTNNNGSNLLT
ncbi:glass [Musca autumnalis]|uniref:glass n=1 Tax=Musca autumnalis TaxID=221902 RepID=UPI003CF0341A